jgi:hypothetical protein
MAFTEKREQYKNAVLDLSDKTLTEYGCDEVRVYSIEEILKRWDGVPDIVLTIERRVDLPPTEER